MKDGTLEVDLDDEGNLVLRVSRDGTSVTVMVDGLAAYALGQHLTHLAQAAVEGWRSVTPARAEDAVALTG